MLRSLRAEIALVFGALAFAFSGIIAKLLLTSGLSAWRLAEIRATGAFLILLIYVFVRKRASLKASRTEIPLLALFGVIGFAAVQVGYFLAIARLHVSTALIIEFTAPIWIVLYIRFVRKKFVPLLMWLSIAMGFSGLLLVAQVWQGMTLNGFGVLAAFLDALAFAAYFLLGEKVNADRSTDALAVWGLGFASLAWAIVTPWWSFPIQVFNQKVNLLGALSHYTLPGWSLILWIVVMGTIVPYLLVLYGLKALSASTASIIGMLEPIFAGIIAWWWLRETFSPIQLLGGVFVIVGIITADRARRQTQ